MLSIILPCFNVARYIERAVNSLVNQNLDDYEIIIVDDGSTDDLLDVCEQWKDEKRIKIVHTENQGVSEARNTGLRIARGEYVYFMDPDDWIDEGALEELMKVCLENNVDALQFRYKLVDFEGNEVKNEGLEIKDDNFFISKGAKEMEIVDGKDMLPRFIGYSIEDLSLFGKPSFKYNKEYSIGCCFIIKRLILVENDIFYPKSLHFMEDKIFLSEFLCYADKIIKYNKVCYNYYIREQGLHKTNFNNTLLHAKQRLLGEKYRQALTKKMIKKGIELEPYFQGTLILASIELFLNFRKGQVGQKWNILKKLLAMDTLKRAYEYTNPKKFPMKLKIAFYTLNFLRKLYGLY